MMELAVVVANAVSVKPDVLADVLSSNLCNDNPYHAIRWSYEAGRDSRILRVVEQQK